MFWKTKPLTQEDALKALEAVAFKEGVSLVESKRLSPLVIEPGKIMLSIAVSPEEAASMEPVRFAAEQALKALPGIETVLVSLTADHNPAKAAPKTPPQFELPRKGGPRQQPVSGIKHIIAVASGKGGVGKSTTSCNLALALSAMGLKIGLMDADIYGPSVPTLFGLKERPSMREGGLLEPLSAHGLKLMSIGFLVDEEAPMIWRGPMVMGAIQQMLRQVAWGELDALIVDMPPGTGDAQLTLAQSVPLAGAVIVSTPQDLALIDARRGVAMFQRTNIPILGLIENMATFICPHCGTRSDIFGHGGARSEAKKLGVPFLGEIPLTMAIRTTSDAGEPIVVSDPDSVPAQSYRAIAEGLWAGLMANIAGTKPAPRIIIE
jgi:ATP-binding protein involved in chromosome partitioning